MAHGMKRRIGLAFSVASIVLTVTATSVLAGEVTGSGKKENQNQGMSWCSFSGLNDKIAGQGPTDPQSQSFGQDVKLGLYDQSNKTSPDAWMYPGQACNPNHTLLGANPDRTH